MRIALVGPVYPYRGGIAHYTTRLVEMLRDEGHDVYLLSFRRQYPRRLFPGKSDRDPSDRGRMLPDTLYLLDSLNPLTWFESVCRLRSHKPEVLVLQWWTAFWALIWVILARGVRWGKPTRVVFVCHNVVPHEAKRWERLVSRWVLAQGHGWVVHTEDERSRLLALLPDTRPTLAAHPVYDIFGVEDASADGQVVLPSQAEARAKLQLAAEGPLLLFFGLVRPYKGLDDLLDALGEVVAVRPDVRLVVAGDFWGNYAHYAGRVAALRLEQAVTLHDRYVPNEEVATYFASADVLVAPYRRATGSGVIQIARGLGKPVIGTDVVAPTAAQAADWQGRIVAAGDPRGLAAAILDFLQSPPTPVAPVAARETWRTLTAALLAAARPGGS